MLFNIFQFVLFLSKVQKFINVSIERNYKIYTYFKMYLLKSS